MTALGTGWRPELARAIEGRVDLDFVEVLAENLIGRRIPRALDDLRASGKEVYLHCVSINFGGACLPEKRRLKEIDALARRLGAKYISDHICFTRAGNRNSGHLLPVPRTEAALRVLVDNISYAREHLSVPLALENIAAISDWTSSPLDEAEFVRQVVERTDSLLLLDVANLYANSINHKFDAVRFLRQMPLDRLAYVHVAGGTYHGNRYHDTHAHQIPSNVYRLLVELSSLAHIPGVMLERDDHFPFEYDFYAEFDALKVQVAVGHRQFKKNIEVTSCGKH